MDTVYGVPNVLANNSLIVQFEVKDKFLPIQTYKDTTHVISNSEY